MIVQSITLKNALGTEADILLEDGRIGSGPYPPKSGEWARAVDEWLASGNSATSYQQPDLADVKAAAIARAWAYCEGRIASGVVTGQSSTASTPIDHYFLMDKFTRESIQVQRLEVVSGAATVDFYPLGETSQVEFTASEWSTIAAAAKSFVENKVSVYKSIEATILSAADADAVAVIDVTDGY
tara:strand:+ start:555 stop:1106 length:552 start_codon:yes stop_codon:yes gene_type:complete